MPSFKMSIIYHCIKIVFFFLNFIISFKIKHHVIAILNQNSLLVALATSESLKPSDCCVFITTCVENLLQYVISLRFFYHKVSLKPVLVAILKEILDTQLPWKPIYCKENAIKL